jgi:hypothetical protein
MVEVLHLDAAVAALLLDERPKRVGHFFIDISEPEDEDWMLWLESVYRALIRAAKQRKIEVVYTDINPSMYFMPLPEAVAYYEQKGFERLGEDWQGHPVLRKAL